MKRAEFILALWGVAGLAAGLQAGDCDCPKTTSTKQCVCLDDSGVLDHIDKVASQFHASFKKNFRLISKLGKGGSSCEAGPSCGCEIAPSCGCEMKPSCGCEMKPGCDSEPSCGCELSVSRSQSINETHANPPTTSYSPLRANSPPNMVAPQPVPDAQQNPFADEPRSSQSKVRGRTIQYRTNSQPQYSPSQTSQPSHLQSMPGSRPRPTYGQQYNPQARNTSPSSQFLGETMAAQRPLQLVAPASSETPTIDQVFKSAYRKNLSDTPEPSNQDQSRVTNLRPVPTRDNDAGLSVPSSRNSSRLIIPTEPIRDLNDPYEREESTEIRTQDNPLRR